MIDNLRKKITFLLLVFLSFSSCQDVKKVEKPDNLIPEAKMIDVLTEMALVHAARNYNKKKLESTGIEPEKYIFEKFNIDSLQFERSNDYYSDQYNDYERIYDSVKVRLQILKKRLDSIRDIEVKIEDSIKQARKDSIKALDSLNIDSLEVRDSLKVDSLRLSRLEERKESRDSLISPPASVSGDDMN